MTNEYEHAIANRTNTWVSACGGTETPFASRSGVRLLYCYNPGLEQHAYLNLDTDTILTNEEARVALGV